MADPSIFQPYVDLLIEPGSVLRASLCVAWVQEVFRGNISYVPALPGAGRLQEKLEFIPARLEGVLTSEIGAISILYSAARVDYCTVTISLSDPVIVTTEFKWDTSHDPGTNAPIILDSAGRGSIPSYGNPYSFEARAISASSTDQSVPPLVVFGPDFSPLIQIFASKWGWPY
jgi:hypothetical protein